MIVIKVGGNELDRPEFLEGFAEVVATLPERVVIVHGGGRGTTMLMERFGLKAQFIDGLRVTDAQTLELAVMGLVGHASTQLVHALVRASVPALGLSGVDAALVTARQLGPSGVDLGAVGQPVRVDVARLDALLSVGFVPCIASISYGEDGMLLNVNADAVAQQIAIALGAGRLILLTNVPALNIRGAIRANIRPIEVEEAIRTGAITGGMIPKVRSAMTALQGGVPKTLITNLDGLRAFMRGEPAGTTIVPAAPRAA